MSASEVSGWGREIVPVSLNGSLYTASAGSICHECADLFGSVTVETLERYGVTSEIWQVSLAFWFHTFPEACGDWRKHVVAEWKDYGRLLGKVWT